ncbi:MAG: hypothetical protein MUF45_00555 [Spirosomaceae bacterium]|jgi:hypothetical protein|nr:hypothetical protein [Spirosomataceae bacterium]
MKAFFMVLAVLLIEYTAFSQSVEIYAGHQRAGVDLMWFKNFKNTKDERTRFLFFSRNRASTDYNNSPTAFGSTNAISFNFKNGIGIVGVASLLNVGFTPKVGVQYYKQKGDFMFFGWFVSDLKKNSNLDLFGLFRYQPKFNDQWRGFVQAELFPVYNPKKQFWNLTQRFRLGARYHTWAGGSMMDFNQSGKNTFTKTNNLGVFVRNEF